MTSGYLLILCSKIIDVYTWLIKVLSGNSTEMFSLGRKMQFPPLALEGETCKLTTALTFMSNIRMASNQLGYIDISETLN